MDSTRLKKNIKKFWFKSTHDLAGIDKFPCLMSNEIAFGSEKSSGFETRDSNMLKTNLLQKKKKNEISNKITYLKTRKITFLLLIKKIRFIKYVSFITKWLIYSYTEKGPILSSPAWCNNAQCIHNIVLT